MHVIFTHTHVYIKGEEKNVIRKAPGKGRGGGGQGGEVGRWVPRDMTCAA